MPFIDHAATPQAPAHPKLAHHLEDVDQDIQTLYDVTAATNNTVDELRSHVENLQVHFDLTCKDMEARVVQAEKDRDHAVIACAMLSVAALCIIIAGVLT